MTLPSFVAVRPFWFVSENHYMPLLRDEYIFDITTELENQKKQFYLLYQRTSWYFSLRLESLNNTLNNMYIEVMYHQVY